MVFLHVVSLCRRDMLLKPLLFVVFFCLLACLSNLCDLSLALWESGFLNYSILPFNALGLMEEILQTNCDVITRA